MTTSTKKMNHSTRIANLEEKYNEINDKFNILLHHHEELEVWKGEINDEVRRLPEDAAIYEKLQLPSENVTKDIDILKKQVTELQELFVNHYNTTVQQQSEG